MVHNPQAVKFKYQSSPVSPIAPDQYHLRVIRESDQTVISQSSRPLPTPDGDGFYSVSDFQAIGITFDEGNVQQRFGVSFLNADGQGPELLSDLFVAGDVPQPPDAPSEVVVVLY